VATFFGSYFLDAWKEKESKIMNALVENYSLFDKNGP
jgi:hypothetical protein